MELSDLQDTVYEVLRDFTVHVPVGWNLFYSTPNAPRTLILVRPASHNHQFHAARGTKIRLTKSAGKAEQQLFEGLEWKGVVKSVEEPIPLEPEESAKSEPVKENNDGD